MTDPCESIIAEALDRAGIQYDRNSAQQLDFHIPRLDIFIECKQFHSERIAAQTARAPNIIITQGLHAAKVLAAWIEGQSAMGIKPQRHWQPSPPEERMK